MRPTGLVLLEIPPALSQEEIALLSQKAATKVPQGRLLAVLYQMPSHWETSTPVESTVIRSVMGRPADRSPDTDWEYFGNVAVRACAVAKEQRRVVREFGLTMVRRSGPKAYERRHQLTPKKILEAHIPALDPVFTRDIANNVWHVPASGAERRIKHRLAALVAWPDEDLLVVRPLSTHRYPVQPLDTSGDLIGVPTKSAYSWFTGQEPLFTD